MRCGLPEQHIDESSIAQAIDGIDGSCLVNDVGQYGRAIELHDDDEVQVGKYRLTFLQR